MLPMNLREREGEYVRLYTNALNLQELEMKIVKDLSHLELLKDFKITRKMREIIWETDEEYNRMSKFKRLLPSSSYLNYRKYFSKENMINLFLSLRELDKDGINFKKANIINIKQN
jgi:hypothetical protein